jgi:hypothetical protein
LNCNKSHGFAFYFKFKGISLPNQISILMHFKDTGIQLSKIIESNLDTVTENWLADKMNTITQAKSTKDLYLTYSLIATKVALDDTFDTSAFDADLKEYIHVQKGNVQQIVRIYLLLKVLEADEDFFSSKVANIIQVADTSELETFLKFLILLPNPEKYKTSAVDALRTNISTVFNAIAFNNPYPGKYFDEQQWNQMYLKTIFIEGDLSAILDVDERANKDLTRIIFDYAHERWAASREIDPYFWRPVSKFLNKELLSDMKRLLVSENPMENKAAVLCLFNSDHTEALELLKQYPELLEKVKNKTISWSSLKD